VGSVSQGQGTVAEDGEEWEGGGVPVPCPRLRWQEEHLHLGTETILVLLLGLSDMFWVELMVLCTLCSGD
jgi:hypothetical protein